ncbi:MAG: hypothetical protein IKH59_03165 [Bacteroidaceae bacterium]|nr:hypothetical protein [Bacteroidaceae bacterium]
MLVHHSLPDTPLLLYEAMNSWRNLKSRYHYLLVIGTPSFVSPSALIVRTTLPTS